MKISVKSDVKGALKTLNDAQRKVVPQAAAAALNRAAKATHTSAIREASKALRVPQKPLRARVRFQKRDRATRRKLTAQLFAVERDMPMAKAGKPRQTKKGARAGKYFEPGAFVATMPGGHRGIFRRIGKKRLPVLEEKIEIRSRVRPIIERQIRTTGMTTFQKRFYHELSHRLRRKGLL